MILYPAVVLRVAATQEPEAVVQVLTGLMFLRTLRQTEAAEAEVAMLMVVVLLMAQAEELEEAMALAAEVEVEAVMPLPEEMEELPAV